MLFKIFLLIKLCQIHQFLNFKGFHRTKKHVETATLSISLCPRKRNLLKGLMVPNDCRESCNLHLNRKNPKCSGVHFSFYSRRQSIFHVYSLKLKGHCGAGLWFISLVHSQLGITSPARVMLNVCPEQHPKKRIGLEGIFM